MNKLKYGLIVIYVLFVLLITVLLFTFNKFSNSVVGNKIITGINYNVDIYKTGDLLIGSKNMSITKGDRILFYDIKNGKNHLSVAAVLDIKKTSDTTYVIRDNEFLSSEYVIGNTSLVKRIPLIGFLYLFFTSRIGYLLFVVVPIILYFVSVLRKYRKE